jgi:hypothetical protein
MNYAVALTLTYSGHYLVKIHLNISHQYSFSHISAFEIKSSLQVRYFYVTENLDGNECQEEINIIREIQNKAGHTHFEMPEVTARNGIHKDSNVRCLQILLCGVYRDVVLSDNCR